MTTHTPQGHIVVNPQPGWYPDPQAPQSKHRWWDGQQWTHTTRPLAQQQPQGAPAPVGAPGAAAASHRQHQQAQSQPGVVGHRSAPPHQPGVQQRPGAGFAANGRTPGASSADIDDTAFWTMVGLLPVAMLLTLVVPEGLAQTVTVGATGANIGMATLDMQRNPWMEEDRSKAAWLVAVALLVPVYVFMRDTSAPGNGRWRFWTYLGTLLAGVVLIGVATAVATAIQSQSAAPADLSADVEVAIEDAVGGAAEIDVDCPTEPVPAVGDTITCSGLEDGTVPFAVDVTIRDNFEFVWEVTQTAISGDVLADQIAREIGAAVGSTPTVECPSFDESIPGTEFTCSARFDDGSSETVTAVVTDELGGVQWDVAQ